MRRTLVVVVVVLIAGCVQRQIGDAEFPAGEVQLAVPEQGLPWGPCPPGLPAGCEIAVLEGDPRAAGLFTVRFRLSDSFVMPAHTHPKDERVTVLSGRMAVAFGRGAMRDDARRFGPGDYYVNARDAVHTVWVDEPSVIQITGIGPWEADFVDE